MFDINVRSRPLCNVLLRNIFLPFSPPAHKTKILFVAVCTIPTSLLLNDEWWINRACITDSMKFPIELFSAFNSLFSSFSLHFSCLCFFVKKISLTFCWQFSCVSNQDIDFLISITKHELKVKTDIMNFE